MDTTPTNGNPEKASGHSAAGLPRKRENRSVQRALSDRMTLSESIEGAARIVDAYPSGGRDAGKGYLGALAATLATYPRCVSEACCDPRRGIVQDSKFMPAIAEVVQWCEKKVKPLYDQERSASRVAQQLAARDEVDRSGRLTYAELLAKYGDGQGGWGIDVVRKRWQPPSAAELEAMVGPDAWRKIKDLPPRSSPAPA